MSIKINKLVLSSDEFDTIKEAEDKVNGWWRAEQLKVRTKLYKVTEVYYPEIKFIKKK